MYNKLILHDLDYKGKCVSGTREAILDNVKTYHALCLKEGAPDFPCPTEPHTYSELIPILRKKGLISSFPSEDPDVVSEVSSQHREQPNTETD